MDIEAVKWLSGRAHGSGSGNCTRDQPERDQKTLTRYRNI